MNLPLIEKYRPKEITEVVNNESFEKLVDNPSEMPNLLFYGPQGTGKSTVMKILLDKLSPIDVKRINGSDTTGVDTIRETVYNYITSMSSVKGKPKIIWIEEFDFMSANAYAALRAMMEQFMGNARFFCTCNYIDKIPAPIQSRFTSVEFKPISKDKIFERLKYVSIKEYFAITDGALMKIAEMSRGDLRSALNNLQKVTTRYKDITEDMIGGETETTLAVYEMLMNGEWSKIRYEIPQLYPDYDMLISELDEKFFKEKLPINTKVRINQILAQGMFEMNFSFDKNIAFSAICSRLIEALQADS